MVDLHLPSYSSNTAYRPLDHHAKFSCMQTKQRLAEEGIDWQDELTEYQPIDDYCDVRFPSEQDLSRVL